MIWDSTAVLLHLGTRWPEPAVVPPDRFGDGTEARIETTPFLTAARGVVLARYVAARSRALDALLADAGILRYFADYTAQATAIPDALPPPRPSDNQPFRAGP